MNRRQLLAWTFAASVISPARLHGAPEAEDRCARLERQIRELRLKLRMGYTARQGRLWREKLVGLEAEAKRLCR